CDFPPNIAHGHYTTTSTTYLTTVATYACDKGYRLVGEANISCWLSQWRSAAPECKALCQKPEIKNGLLSANKDQYDESENVTVRCDFGFAVRGSQSITCSENRTWYPELPKCEQEIQACVAADLLKRVILCVFLVPLLKIWYLLIGSATSRCVVQGKGVDWSDSLPECIIVTCESPPDISNGKHSGREEDLYTYGSSVIYSCDTGFTLLGDASIICTVVNKTIGVWSPSPPACENGCTGLPDIPYAFWEGNKLAIRNFQMFEIGTKLKYQCKPGYQSAPNDPQIVTCQENLMWTPTKGCQRICCPIPDMEEVKIVSERRDYTGMCTYAYGDYIFYVCGEGSSPVSPDGRSACQEDGKWNPSIPSCQAGLQNSPAVAPPKFTDANLSFKYIADNDESTRYVAVKAMCPKPVIVNGSLSVEKDQYAVTENITIHCDAGYSMVGSPNIICSENRTWYPEIPNCKMLYGNHKAETYSWYTKQGKKKSISSITEKLANHKVRVSIAAMKHHDQKANWRGKRLFGLHFQIIVYHWKKSEQELKQDRNLEAGVDAEAMDG
ncbi:hypothetical protein STEG23_033903, partial [Scotinomys teguina]